MTDDLKVRHVMALAVRVLDRLLRDNPFTYLPGTAQMGKRVGGGGARFT